MGMFHRLWDFLLSFRSRLLRLQTALDAIPQILGLVANCSCRYPTNLEPVLQTTLDVIPQTSSLCCKLLLTLSHTPRACVARHHDVPTTVEPDSLYHLDALPASAG